MLLQILDFIVEDLNIVSVLVWSFSWLTERVPFLLFLGPIQNHNNYASYITFKKSGGGASGKGSGREAFGKYCSKLYNYFISLNECSGVIDPNARKQRGLRIRNAQVRRILCRLDFVKKPLVATMS